MTRTLRVAALAAVLVGLGPYHAVKTASAQDVVCNVSVSNRDNVPILIKRIGQAEGDQAEGEVRPNETASFEDVPFQGDQVFIAWNPGGKCIGTQTIQVATARDFHVVMIAQNGRLIIELARKGAEGPIANNRPRLDPDAGDEAFARNLGIYYRQVRYSNGTFGARVTRPPADGTPAAELSFEPGDIITALDGQPFRTHQDILSHREETTVDFINVRTNERQTATVFIP